MILAFFAAKTLNRYACLLTPVGAITDNNVMATVTTCYKRKVYLVKIPQVGLDVFNLMK